MKRNTLTVAMILLAATALLTFAGCDPFFQQEIETPPETKEVPLAANFVTGFLSNNEFIIIYTGDEISVNSDAVRIDRPYGGRKNVANVLQCWVEYYPAERISFVHVQPDREILDDENIVVQMYGVELYDGIPVKGESVYISTEGTGINRSLEFLWGMPGEMGTYYLYYRGRIQEPTKENFAFLSLYENEVCEVSDVDYEFEEVEWEPKGYSKVAITAKGNPEYLNSHAFFIRVVGLEEFFWGNIYPEMRYLFNETAPAESSKSLSSSNSFEQILKIVSQKFPNAKRFGTPTISSAD